MGCLMTTADGVPGSAAAFPPPPARIFLVGLGGIGVSGLAQLLSWQGYLVAGSDRDLHGPGRDELYAQLAQAGIQVFPQDGSGVAAFQPEVLVYSSAVEQDNPDLAQLGSRLLVTRATALAAALNRLPARQIAVAGSCGKTSVTAWLFSALKALGQPALAVCGGYMNDFRTATAPGNFAADPRPVWAVIEVDESDGSLVAFSPYAGVVLNVGTDHHSRERLHEMFSTFLARCSGRVLAGAAAARELTFPPALPPPIVFEDTGAEARPGDPPLAGAGYCPGVNGMRFTVAGGPQVVTRQHGRHSMANALAVLACLEAILPEVPVDRRVRALASFTGVHRRFDRLGSTPTGCAVYDDYAHNVEKLAAVMDTAREAAGGAIAVIFQPHGYGPLRFMREALMEMLLRKLRPGDSFGFLPVYYAGGTTTFEPTSEAVAAELAASGLPVVAYPDRGAAAAAVAGLPPAVKALVVAGARDPSLPTWARSLTAPA